MASLLSLQPGQVFASKYRVIRLVKAGGMGAVYEVRHTHNDKRWALKLMHPKFARDAAARERFALEAKIDGLIESAFVVSVIDAGIDEATGSPYLVMEYLVGEELGERLDRAGRFSAEETVRYLGQVARGLDKAHAKKIVHRDLKPDNLFLCVSEDDGERVKILDFGIAKLMQTVAAQSTQGGGTLLYMAPEQTRRGRDIGPWTDVWALGLIGYTLLVGRSYWHAESHGELYGELLTNEPRESPSRRAALAGVALPSAFDDWFFQCVNNDPTQRFASAGAAIAALANVMAASVPPRAIPELPGRLSPAPAGPAETLLQTIHLSDADFDVVPAVTAGVDTTGAPVAAVPRSPDNPKKLPGPLQNRKLVVAAVVALGVLAGGAYFALPQKSALVVSVAGPENQPVDSLEVSLDGAKRCGSSPCLIQGLPAGIHLLNVRAPGYDAIADLAVELPPGEETAQHVSLTPIRKSSGLRVTSQARGIQLSVDGKAMGPLPQDLSELTPGDHLLAFDGGDRYESREQRVTLESGKVQTLEPKLKVKKGLATMRLGLNGEGAKVVLVNGTERRPLPVVPISVDLTTDQPWRLVATKRGYVDYDVPLEFEDGQAERTFVVDLVSSSSFSSCGCASGDLQCAMRCAAKGEPTAQVLRPALPEPPAPPQQESANATNAASEPFNKSAAVSTLSAAAAAVGSCKKDDGPSGPGRVTLTFAPSGRVTSAVVDGGAFAGTTTGGCVASLFRKANVPPFSGTSVTVSKGFSIE